MTLKERLDDWTDWDVAAHGFAVCLGLLPDDLPFGNAKHLFWSDHPTGKLLHSMLNQLTEQAILKKRDEPDLQYQWNSEFAGTWN